MIKPTENMHVLALAIGLALGGCAAVAPTMPPPPLLVYGTISDVQGTDWARDFCLNDAPVKLGDLYVGKTCMSIGSEINIVTLSEAKIIGGSEIPDALKVAYVGHGLMQTYRRAEYLVLQPAPDNLRAATGISYFVWRPRQLRS